MFRKLNAKIPEHVQNYVDIFNAITGKTIDEHISDLNGFKTIEVFLFSGIMKGS